MSKRRIINVVKALIVGILTLITMLGCNFDISAEMGDRKENGKCLGSGHYCFKSVGVNVK